MRTFLITAAEAKKIADALIPCMSKEQTRYYLNGVCIQNGKDGLIAVATDGHKMGKLLLHPMDEDGKDVKLDEQSISYILPREAVEWLGKLKSLAEESTVRFSFTEAKVTLELQPLYQIASFKLVRATYPDWQRCWPSEMKLAIGFNPHYLKDLCGAAARANGTKLRGGRIEMQLADANTAAVLDAGKDLNYLLMPMRA